MTSSTSSRFLDRSSPPHIFTLIALASVSALAMNVYLPLLPQMAVHFETTPAVMGLSVGIFLAASAVIQVIAGPISDLVGRRPVIVVALVVFILATLASLFTSDVTVFLILRAVQASAAVCMTLARAIVRDTVEGPRAASLIAYVTMGMAVVPMIAPTFGGYLGQYYGWEASFVLLLIVGIGLFVLSLWDLGETAPRRQASFRAQMAEYPELLRSPRFWGYCLSAALGSGSFFAYLGGAPFVGSEVFGLEPQELGLVFGAPAVGYILGNFLSGRYSERIGIDPMVLGGLLITTGAAALSLVVSLLGHGSVASFFGFMVIVAVGNGMTIPNATAGMLSVRPHLAGSASGLGSAIMIGGGAVLSALAGLVLEGGTSEVPLLAIMVISAVLALPVMFYVIARRRRLQR